MKDVRTIGALGVIETDLAWEDMMDLRKKFIARDVFLRPFGGVIYFMPSLNISIVELRAIIDAVTAVL